jgi:hypothetical protein
VLDGCAIHAPELRPSATPVEPATSLIECGRPYPYQPACRTIFAQLSGDAALSKSMQGEIVKRIRHFLTGVRTFQSEATATWIGRFEHAAPTA